MKPFKVTVAMGITMFWSLSWTAHAAPPKHISCPDGDHIEIDVKEISIKYSGAGFNATLGGLSKLELTEKQLQNAAEATQQWNQFIEGLVIGYNSCAITRQQYADSLNRIYPRLKEDTASLETMRQAISKGQAADASTLRLLTNRFASDLQEFARASGKEEILNRIQSLSEQNKHILEVEQQIKEQQGANTEAVLAQLKELSQQLKTIPLATPTEIATAVTEVRKALLHKADAAEKSYDKGYALLKSDHPTEAIPYLLEAIDSVPLPQFYSSLGRAYSDSHDNKNALLAYRNVTRLAPNDHSAHNAIGLILTVAGDDDEAEQEFKLAISLKPDNATYHSNLSIVEMTNEHLKEALVQGQEAIRLQPRTASFHGNLAQLYVVQEKKEEAIEQGRIAVEIDPDSAYEHERFGDLFSVLHEYQNAVEQFRLALSKNNDDVDAHLGLAWALFNSGMRVESIEEFRHTIAIQPKTSSAWTGLGWAYYRDGKNADAQEYFRKAIGFYPNNGLAHRGLAATLYTNGKFDDAIAEDMKALDISPDDQDAHRDLGGSYLQVDRWEDAASQFRMVLKDRPDDGQVKSGLGIALFNLKQHQEANQIFEGIYGDRPQDFNTQFYAGLTFLAVGSYVRAISPLLQARALDSSNALIPSFLCSAYFGAHRYKDAATECQHASKLEPNNASFHQILSYALGEIGEKAESSRELERANALKEPHP